ncbi:methionine synthase [Gymnodinialimonas hymeniacidonis]|uniref:methionine synthase n=1 Tax=Gymnodinialimonas hymeniacidonis TaxID=3126508 RepID=UPI0034C696FB
MRSLFIILGCLSLVAWFLWYQFIASMACAFGSVSGNCTTPAPWELNSEDLQFMVLIPGAITLAFFVIAFFAKSSKKNDR